MQCPPRKELDEDDGLASNAKPGPPRSGDIILAAFTASLVGAANVARADRVLNVGPAWGSADDPFTLSGSDFEAGVQLELLPAKYNAQ